MPRANSANEALLNSRSASRPAGADGFTPGRLR